MQTWAISYTSDKHKSKNRHWLLGKMNYNTSTGVAHFYDEDGEALDKMKLDSTRIASDLELNLKRHLVEIGQLEMEEESSEAVFERLNRELGIQTEDFNGKSAANKVTSSTRISVMKPKIPTPVSVKEPTVLYDILYTRDMQKKSKTWHDGVLKYHPELKLAEFYSEEAVLLHKKIIDVVKEGLMIETGSIILEISSIRQSEAKIDENVNIPNTIKLATKKEDSVSRNPIVSNNSTKSSNGIDSQNSKSFNILYSSDKHKKSKKWFDGRMNFASSTGLAKFYSEDGSLFFKKCIKSEDALVGAEFESGQYIFQVDCEESGIPVTIVPVEKSEAKRSKTMPVSSIMSSSEVPLQGRSDEELISLLRKNNK
jgi:hypothetical protein